MQHLLEMHYFPPGAHTFLHFYMAILFKFGLITKKKKKGDENNVKAVKKTP